MVFGMPKRSSTGRDPNTLAFRIAQEATGQATPSEAPAQGYEKNPAAVALGRLGGLRSGATRKQATTPDQRRDYARIAARARWSAEGRAKALLRRGRNKA